jgi:hypothetical protein
MKLALGLLAAASITFGLVACDDAEDNDDDGTGDASADDDDGGAEAQTPPMTGHADLQAWLAEGHYESWTCEAAPHAATIGVSPHAMQRICANDLMTAHTDGEYPVGASAVKELFLDDGTRYGFAVSLHFEAGTGGESWYWYEQVHADHPAPHDENGVVADGIGDAGPAQAICVGCHSAAGLDATHPGHDFVYVQVQ